MFGIESLPGPTGAITTVGVVFVEAIALYLVYGVLSRFAGSALLDTIGGE